MLEVVDRAALYFELFAAALAAHLGHGDEFSAGEILTGDGIALQQLVHRALKYDLAAVAARARANVHDMIGREHGVLVVLDHDQRIAEVAQTLKGREQLVVVALMQADGRLVEDIQHAHERRADLRGEADALALAARQRAGRARERQIFQTDRPKEAEAVHDLLDDAVADLVLHLTQPERVQKLHRLDDRFFREFRDVESAERDREHLGAQAAAMAGRTRAFAHDLLDLAARPVAVCLAVAALEIGDDALERLTHHAARNAADRQLEHLVSRAVEQLVERLSGQFLNGRFERKAVLSAERSVVHIGNAARLGVRPAGRADRALLDGQSAVGDDAVGVHDLLNAEAGADRARAVGIVEREHARRQLLNGNAAVIAGVVLRKAQLIAADDIRDEQTARQRARGLDRVGDAAARVRTDDNAVDDDLDAVLFRLGELELFGKVMYLAVHAHTDIALPAGILEYPAVLALLAADDRREQLHARLFRQRHQPVDDLVDGLLMDLFSAFRAVRRADARPEQTHIVVDLRDRADGRARVLRGGLLVDGDGRGQAVDIVHIRLVHLAEELPRIARQRLDIAALTLGVDRIERQ